ncbi:hypothetical protein [Nocardioides pocheonensis]|uniref:Uncharacterized protein n=1 Tax=Nocardioides pocheonensis TaxID=661485 RepID=A0A3N0GKI6_9ACTN|nr:hypothetical protein [Nocardioides pocheonensis]RNM12580.1 hypothetical protein EFL26_18330 [Nocardioides pocheonensis]
MTDQHEPDRVEPALGGPLGAPDAEDFDDPGHTWVRDLLAEARSTSPVPDDVAARLEETLAGLRAERASAPADSGAATSPDSPSVLPLRRRLRPRLSAAAAAVILLGGGGVAVAQLGGNGSSTSDSASSKSAADSGGAAAARPNATGSSSGAAAQDLAGSALPRLTSASFAADAAQVMRQVAVLDTASGSTKGYVAASPSAPVPAQTPSDVAPGASTTAPGPSVPLQAPPVTATPPTVADEVRSAAGCAGPSAPDGVTLQATLDGTPVALVFRSPTATGQRVEAWSCDGSTLLRSAVIGR